MIFVVERHTPWVAASAWKPISAYVTRDEALSEIKSYDDEGTFRIVQVQSQGVLASILERS